MKLILKKPVITEKAINNTTLQYYTFEVDRFANKHQIKNSVESLFGVTVEDVKTLIRKGSEKRVGKTRRLTKSSTTKRAIVKIAKGQSIDLFTIPADVKDDKSSKKQKNKETKKQENKKTKDEKNKEKKS